MTDTFAPADLATAVAAAYNPSKAQFPPRATATGAALAAAPGAAWAKPSAGVAAATGTGGNGRAVTGNGTPKYVVADVGLALGAPPPRGLVLPGQSAVYATSGDSAALSVTGDIDIRIKITMVDWVPGTDTDLFAKWRPTLNQRSYLFYIAADGTLQFRWSPDGTTVPDTPGSVSIVGVAPYRPKVVRVTFDADDGASHALTKFWLGDDTYGPFTQLGATVQTTGASSIQDNASQPSIGMDSSGIVGFGVGGRFHRVQIRNNIADDGSLVYDANFEERPTGAAANFNEGAKNALVAFSGNPRILDFGPAAAASVSASASAATGAGYQPAVGATGPAAAATGAGADAGKTVKPNAGVATATGTANPAVPVRGYATEVLADTPTLYWRLGESVSPFADSSGNGHGGTSNGGTLAVQGLLGADPDRAIRFTAASQRVRTADSPGYGNVATFAFEAWVSFATFGADGRVGFSGEGAISLNADGTVYGYWNDSAVAFYQTPSQAISSGTRHHLVFSYDGTIATIYVDGTAAQTLAASTTGMDLTLSTPPNNFIVGLFSGSVDVVIDEAAFYTHSLSAARVQQHWLAGGLSAVSAGPGIASATAAAYNPAYSTFAQLASATGAAYNPSRPASAPVASATGTGLAATGVGGKFALPTVATATATANQTASFAMAESAAATGTANPAILSWQAYSGIASAVAAAHSAVVSAATRPTITSVAPMVGSPLGGDTIVLTGTNFTGATSLRFGTTEASFTVDSPTQITAISPPHQPGNYAIYVTTPGGTNPVSLSAAAERAPAVGVSQPLP